MGRDFAGYPDAIVINRFVECMKNKVIMNKRLDALNILHPKTYYYPFDNLPRNNRECVVKRRFGRGGRHLRFSHFDVVNTQYLTENSFIQDYIPFEKEYRVIIDPFGVVGIKRKLGDAKIKNNDSGHWSLITYGNNYNHLSRFAIDVCGRFGVDFAGLDIGKHNDEFYVIELNSAPGMSKIRASIFANNLLKLVDIYDRTH